MKKTNFIRENTAVAGVIEALLLVALVAIILGLIQLNYVPEIMEQRESDHMDEVANQLSFLKAMIDVQSMTGEDIPISSPITLGSNKLPYFVTAASSGEVYIYDKDNCKGCKIQSSNGFAFSEFLEFNNNGIPLTSIKYKANSFYYIKQIYVLEGGSIILKQTSGKNRGEDILVEPPITTHNYSSDIKIDYEIPVFNSRGKNQTSGFDTTFIRTNYTKEDSDFVNNNNWIRIYTYYPDAWNRTLIRSSSGLLWEYYNNGYIDVDVYDSGSPAYIEITPGSKNLDIEFTVIEIGAQIGPGYEE